MTYSVCAHFGISEYTARHVSESCTRSVIICNSATAVMSAIIYSEINRDIMNSF